MGALEITEPFSNGRAGYGSALPQTGQPDFRGFPGRARLTPQVSGSPIKGRVTH